MHALEPDVVVTGRVRILDGDDGEVALLGPGEFFGEFSLLLGTAHQFDAVAVEDCELLVVPKERVDELLAANADVAASIRATLDERMAANAARAAPST